MIPTNCIGSNFRYVSLLLAAVFLWVSAYSAEANNAASVIEAYKSSNSVERRMALNSISDVVSTNGNVAGWVNDLLASALDDKSPVVVSVAVKKIGEFEIKSLSSNLITLYHEADKKFSSAYADRVRFAIVPALGKLGGNGVGELLTKLLAQDNGTVMGEYVLLAIKDLNDASLKDAVTQYKVKMQEMVTMGKAKNYDPIIYSRMEIYIGYALQVEKSLMEGGK